MESRTYNINEVITFQKTNEEFGGLSNMCAGYSLNINGVIIPTSEHLYQASRFPLFPDIQKEIIAEKSPMTAKMISRKYNYLSRQDWDSVRIKIMRWTLEVKLVQNWNKFSYLLARTASKTIVEVSNRDKIWGAQKKGDLLIGVNALGRLLMELRDKNVFSPRTLYCVETPQVTGMLLFNNPIETVCEDAFIEEFELSHSL